MASMNLFPTKQRHIKFHYISLIVAGLVYALVCIAAIVSPQYVLDLYTEGKPTTLPLAFVVLVGVVGVVAGLLNVMSGVWIKRAQTAETLKKSLLVGIITSLLAYALAGPLSLFGLMFLMLFLSGFLLRREIKKLS